MTVKIAEFQIPRKGRHKGMTAHDPMMTFPTVSEWINGLRHGQASGKTKASYLWGMFLCCRGTAIDPDDLIRERENEAGSSYKKTRFHAEDTFREFFNTFKGTNSIGAKIDVSVKSFYSYHRYPLQEKGIAYKSSGALDYIPSSEETLKLYFACE